jgi:hypothetical protein
MVRWMNYRNLHHVLFTLYHRHAIQAFKCLLSSSSFNMFMELVESREGRL